MTLHWRAFPHPIRCRLSPSGTLNPSLYGELLESQQSGQRTLAEVVVVDNDFCRRDHLLNHLIIPCSAFVARRATVETFEESLNIVRHETDDVSPRMVEVGFELADAFAALPVIGNYFQSLTTWDYTSVGTLKFIDWSGKIVGESRSSSTPSHSRHSCRQQLST